MLLLLTLICGKKKKLEHNIWIALYLTFLISVVILGRPCFSKHSSFETVFNTYKLFFLEKDYSYAYEIILNIALFIPWGIIVEPIKRKTSMLVILLLTLSVEVIQGITGTGLFELCDIANNFIGGLVGIALMKCIRRINFYIKNHNIEKSKENSRNNN